MIELTHRVIAETALAGMGIDVLGGCYLAYDLLGGKRGPLRTLVRAAAYTVMFYIGYGALLGWRYAIIASIGMGALLALEFRKPLETEKLGKFEKHLRIFFFGMSRGLVLGVASTAVASMTFAIIFGLFSGIGLAATYVIGFAPVSDYMTEHRPRLSRHKILASLWRVIAVSVAGVIAGYFSASGQLEMELKLGCAAGVVSALVSLFSAPLEWWVENLPDRRLGLFGIMLIFIGMVLQSVQYWVVVLDISIT